MKSRTHDMTRFLLCLAAIGGMANAAEKTWTDPEKAKAEDPDFAIQGEYAAAGIGAQVVALGGGKFDAYLLDGGLPGAGWDPGKSQTPLKGALDGEQAVLNGANIAATIEDGVLTLRRGIVPEVKLPLIERKSPTLGAKPPAGAVVLFDGTSADAWEKGKMENGHLLASNATTKQKFASYTLHLEFRTPYKPDSRSQKRGNSGIYHSGRWETQILDSFALEGRDNECGGIYSISKPRLNACLPPLTWQTYDVDFTAATFDESGKRTAWPRITVQLNGITIHENLELSKDFTTSAPINTPLTSPDGPIHLQDHGNPVVFRNIWVIPR